MPGLLRNLRGPAVRALAAARLRLRQPRTVIASVPARGEPPAGPPGFDAGLAWELLLRQCASGPRHPGGAGRAPTRRLILDRMRACAAEVAVQDWWQPVDRGTGAGRRYPMTNVLARFGPAGHPPDLLLATHWDTRPVADADPVAARRGEPPAGANDGGSGVAVLLELARVLRAEPPPRAVALAFLDGEDLGEHCYGGRLFARSLRSPEGARWRPRRAVVIDMVGGAELRCTTDAVSVANAPGLWHEVHEHAAALGLERYFHGPRGRVTDDHVPLARAGVPSIVLIDGGYPYRHTVDDTVARCSADSLAAVGRVLEGLVRAAAPSPAAR
ncbi:M28 family peptidase [Pseudosporangium ferrugineum]|uniref:Peptidase M28-like protein n=1 Tax=Pseudosporangium ferrugineum TaxID=439699 RepID=A0A2T0SAN4_9ACTN|nr:M28 family peptidase [Pseudosporangium ferrugineum]PRY30480.1 peptidase M28-like protein [Pseudosporangium ferrugineum]